ncbi:MAG TPA: aminotransferase class IV, partial [Verrucomicrobiae bacterium]|nr:aminotransferase class IV [Verrucomicrobiae bacterium]
MQSTNYAYVNGRFVPETEATVSIFDRGFLYGDGVFETMRVYDGKIFRLYNHLQRLLAGLKALHIGQQITQEDLRAPLLELIERNKVKGGMARIYVAGGINRRGVKGRTPGEPTLVATTQELPARSGDLRALISSIRLDATSKLAGIKSANRLPYVLAQDEAELKGFTDAVLLNGAGRVVELTTSNVFVIKNGELFTPPLSDGPLPGVTRAAVLMIAARLGVTTSEMSFGTEMFSQADDVFATNSLIEIESVDEVDGVNFREH